MLVLSAWVEGHDQLRVRIRAGGDTEAATGDVFASRADAVAFVGQWLASLLDESGPRL